LDPERLPAIAVAVEGGAVDATADEDPLTDFIAGVNRVLDDD
jgi:hypothetical protein